MKIGGTKLFCLVAFIILPVAWAFSDTNTVALESRILDNFDGSPYKIDGEEYNYTWKVAGSKFSTKTDTQTFPIISPIAAVPQALSRQSPDAKSLGIQGAFDRFGYNWIDIYPTFAEGDGLPVEIPLEGRTRFFDLWVWGSNLNYRMEIYIRDNKGIIHTLPQWSLKYTGWQNLRAEVPSQIQMVSSILPRSTHSTTFVKFRIWTTPEEKTFVDLKRDVSGKITEIVPFYVYIAQLKVLADIYETVYDGDELAYPKKTAELWQTNANPQN
jgi:hypothetical protein